MYKKWLHILIEGDDDKEFFKRIINPMLKARYYPIVLWKYRKKKKEEVDSYLERVKNDWDADYIFVTDNDKLKCVPGKRQEIQRIHGSIHDKRKILLVIRKIESWYLAGLSDDTCRKFGFSPLCTTDGVGKGQFKKLRNISSMPKVVFLQEILRNFDIETAKRKNESFRYFAEEFVKKYGLQSMGSIDNGT